MLSMLLPASAHASDAAPDRRSQTQHGALHLGHRLQRAAFGDALLASEHGSMISARVRYPLLFPRSHDLIGRDATDELISVHDRKHLVVVPIEITLDQLSDREVW